MFAAICALAWGVSPVPRGAAAAPPRPNFLVIVTDDHRADTMAFMPATTARIGGQGVTFANGYATTPLCNPSRASLLTGQYAHTHGAQRNASPLHGSTVFHDLQAAGYRTGLVGKYLNSWNGAPRPEFDYWVSHDDAGDSYVDPTFNVNGTPTPRQGYHTYLLRDYAVDFIEEAAGGSEPFALLVGFKAPHGPAIPAPGDEGLYADLPPARPPNFNEADVSDKPAWLQATPPLSASEVAIADGFRIQQLRALHSVDVAVDSLLTALADSGMLDDTVVVFMGDNGRFQGEHRLNEKSFLYDEGPRVPFLVRYPPLAPAPRTETRFALNVDIAPTIYDLAGLPIPASVEGRSLVPLLADTAGSWREDMLVESWSNDGEMPIQLEAVRTAGYAYIENRDDASELYDLAADPFQLENVAGAPAHAAALADMRARLARYRAAYPVDDGAVSCAYDGWRGAADAAASGGGYRGASAAGQELRYRTAAPATAVSLVTYRGPDQGVVRVRVDGNDRGTFDLYAPSPQYQHTLGFGGLSNALHTVTVVSTGTKNPQSAGTEVRVDAFLYNAARAEETHTDVAINSWVATTTGFALNSGHHTSPDPSASVRFTVSGTEFTVITARGPSYGIARVIVDGAGSNVDLYAATDDWRSPLRVAGLAPGEHQVEIRPLGARNPSSTNNRILFDGIARPRAAGSDTPGVYAPASGAFFLRNANAPGGADAVFTYGPAGAALAPLAGDWNADAASTVGLYDPSTGAFFLRNSNAPGGADLVFTFGPGGAGLVPLAGDWDGDGDDTVGLYAPATGAFFLRNANAPGGADLVFTFGPGGAFVPVVGDWNGDRVDTVGLYDPATGFFFLRDSNSPGPAGLVFGFGPPGVAPLVGDWNGDGTDTTGVYLSGSATWFLRNANAPGGADAAFSYGPPGLAPLAGDWDGE